MSDKVVIAIFDTKAKFYKSPTMMRTRGEALRAFSDLANDKQTEIGKHPEDFVLFMLATFDEVKGVYHNLPCPESLGVASEFIAPEKE